MAARSLPEALAALGRPTHAAPSAPVLHGSAGSLLTFGVPDARGQVAYLGIWIDPTGVQLLGPVPPATGVGAAHGLSGDAARVFDLFVGTARAYLERVEEVDGSLAETQQHGRSVPLSEIWALQRRVAGLRAQIGRALVAATECGGRFGERFPGLGDQLPSLLGELTRVQELAAGVRAALSDLILLRNAEESNRIADAANELSRVSNRIAALANTSNIRMLGLSYIALILGLVSAVVLIPNTAATILGMPSAAWVPGLWVDLILVVLAIFPLAIVFGQRWVREMLGGMRTYEVRVSEGVADLPEGSAEPPAPRRTQRL